MDIKAILQEAFKFALSMMLFYWFALWMDWDMPKYGGLAILLISLSTAGASLQKGILRIIGTTVGLVVGLFALALYAQDRWEMMVFFAIYLILISYFMQTSRYNYAWFVAGFVPVVLWSYSYMKVDDAFRYSIFRYLETSTGVLIFSLVSAVLWPKKAGELLYKKSQKLWQVISSVFNNCRQALVNKLEIDIRSKIVGHIITDFLQIQQILQAAYTDTGSIAVKKPVWKRLQSNLHKLISTFSLWKESIANCQQLKLNQLTPQLEDYLKTIDERFKEIGSLWLQIKHQTPSQVKTTLFKKISLKINYKNITKLPYHQQAALMNMIKQLELIEQTSREIVNTMNVLAGNAPRKILKRKQLKKSQFSTTLWNYNRFTKALMSALCFISAFIFWILTDPPSGTDVVMMAVVFSLLMLLTPYDPLELLIAILISVCLIVAPVYCIIMPSLNHGYTLLILIFIYSFIFSVVGSRWPLFKFAPMITFIMLTNINNDQSYSIITLINGAMIFILSLIIIAVIYLIFSPTKPEQFIIRDIKRFFYGCGKVLEGFYLNKFKSFHKAKNYRNYYFKNYIIPISLELFQNEEMLDKNYFSENELKNIQGLVSCIHSIAYHLKILESNLEEYSLNSDDPMARLFTLQQQFLSSIQNIFQHWQQFDWKIIFDNERAKLKELSQDFIQALDEIASSSEKQSFDARKQQLYASLAALRGLVHSIISTHDAIKDVDWQRLCAQRF